MATDLGELVPAMQIETAWTLEVPLLVDLLLAGVVAYNSVAGASIVVSGTTLDRDATADEKVGIILCASLAYINGQWLQAARTAVSHSNVAGRTDLGGVADALERRAAALRTQLADLLEGTTAVAIAGEADAVEMGETLDLAYAYPRISPWYPVPYV